MDSRGSIPGRGSDLNLLYSLQTGSGIQPASNPMGTGVVSAGVKRPRCEAHHLHTSSVKVKNSGAIPPLPQYVFKAQCLFS
jgi:hypothetical protein